MADLSGFSALFIVLCSSPGILRQPLLVARERETFGTFCCPCATYSSQVSMAGESEEEEDTKKERKFSIFIFLASIKLS